MLHRISTALLLLLIATPVANAASNEQSPPNIIFILADDLGYGDLGCYGQETLATPRIDRLAAEGMRFTDFYAGNPVCRPSRLSLWTGKDTRHTPVNGNTEYALANDQTTIAEAIKPAGYVTAGTGKWSLLVGEDGHPNDHGFDLWFGYQNQSLAHNHFPPFLWRNGQKVLYPGNILATGNPGYRGRVSKTKTTFSHTELTSEALSFIRENASNPFLLHVHWVLPHANNEAGETLGDGMEVPSYGPFADRDWPNPEKGFAAMIDYLDSDVGKIVDLVDALGLRENTLIIFTSDNGPHAEGVHDPDFFASRGPLRGIKRDLYEGGIRVPFIARWPGTITPASRSDLPAAFCDILPTACDIAGSKPPANIDGRSILPTLLGQKQNHDRPLAWIFEEADYRRAAVRSGKWKAVQYDRDLPWELYDLSEDISESHDIAKAHPKVLQKLVAISQQ